MAKRKKSKPAPRRRRRMGSINSQSLMRNLQQAAGLVGGSMAATVIQRVAGDKLNPKIMAGLQVVAGFMLSDKSSSPLMNGIGLGLVSAGSISLTHSMGLINGLEDLVSGTDTYIESDDVNGMDNRQFIAGMDNRQFIGEMPAGSSDLDMSNMAVGM